MAKMKEAIENMRRAGIKLNAEKYVIKVEECQFLGMIYMPNGIKLNTEKVTVITKTKSPKDKKEPCKDQELHLLS